jgi:hypothetical protein
LIDGGVSIDLISPISSLGELDVARQLIGDAPGMAGAPYVERSGELVRRILLPKTNNHVYYMIDRDKYMVIILAMWGAPKGRAPKL